MKMPQHTYCTYSISQDKGLDTQTDSNLLCDRTNDPSITLFVRGNSAHIVDEIMTKERARALSEHPITDSIISSHLS